MEELILPTQLAGPWQHALILTYGLHIPFFEGTLWREFGASCRNKIVLADGNQLLKAFEEYAAGGLVRMLNQQYIAEGIFAQHAAHAKLILLTNREKGRLLVGSGNLGHGGYASGGEIFTLYEYSPEQLGHLNAFLAVRDLVNSLVKYGYVQGPVENRIEHLWAETPWLIASPHGSNWPVRHNLEESFLAQLRDVVAEEPVEALWIMSPFYDEECQALVQLLETLCPKQVTLLVQRGSTSVSPAALKFVLEKFPNRYDVRAVRRPNGNPYVHAKFYLIKTATRSICLQGSPNLSQVAMLRAHRLGNIELANLLESNDVNAFDYLLDQLALEPAGIPVDELELSYSQPSSIHDSARWVCRLVGGEWSDDWLDLRYQGEHLSLENAALVIGENTYPVVIQQHAQNRLKLKITKDAIESLARPVPILLKWGDGPEATRTNPIFVCNRSSLNAVLEVEGDREILGRIGNLDLDDDEIERLLGELDAVLVIDRQSLWQLVGRNQPETSNDEKTQQLDYEAIDYNLIRQHPKVKQYLTRGSSGSTYIQSRLQLILHAITNHFRGLVDAATLTKQVVDATKTSTTTVGDTEEEVETFEQERVQGHWSNKQRIGRLLTNFLHRYLRGIASPDFQLRVGVEVMTQNYIIFGHLLWRLLERDWVEPKVLLNSLLEMWQLIWGTSQTEGYWSRLASNEQRWVKEFLCEHHADAQFFATLYMCARLCESEQYVTFRIGLRDLWRHMLKEMPFPASAKALEYTWHLVAREQAYDPPRLPAIYMTLAKLAEFETRENFLRTLEQQFGLATRSCHIERQPLYRMALERDAIIECLCMPDKKWLADSEAALHLLRQWMRAEPRLDYYRIQSPGAKQIIFFDVRDQQGTYYDKEADIDSIVDFGSITPLPMPWDNTLRTLKDLAEAVDQDLALDMPEFDLATASVAANNRS